MTAPTELSPKEVVARGKEIYEAQIKALVEPEHIGKYLSIDIETGEWEMGEDHAETAFRARDKFGNHEIFGMRIGYAATASFGGALRPLIENPNCPEVEEGPKKDSRGMYAPVEIVRRGSEIYQNRIRQEVEPGQIGKYLAINVETGEWEIGEDNSETVLRASRKFRHPNVFSMRIGYAAAASFGGTLSPIQTIHDTRNGLSMEYGK